LIGKFAEKSATIKLDSLLDRRIVREAEPRESIGKCLEIRDQSSMKFKSDQAMIYEAAVDAKINRFS
jgi:hypothetical protein